MVISKKDYIDQVHSTAQREVGVNFAEFEQGGIIEALYYGRFDSLSSKRNGVLIYITGIQNTFAEDLFYSAPRCALLLLDSELTKVAANSMLKTWELDRAQA